MQDNDPKHTSRLAKNFFESKKINLLPYPAQSPDLNPIETFWVKIKQKLANLTPKNLCELKANILDDWNSITNETCQQLALSFIKRSNAVYEAKGGHTKFFKKTFILL